ncbi:hypothetical protein [Ancylomarina longa]|uniref:Outer membrane protein beta-barrel domain-containing protein n=1 Tax=Ancylomarina longa TaxID=2487017 RepID=A0A434AU01_9BACT|nr:hypothetical protein [Ancylomarina longa]RUT77921.1 hypothetical protein DLK05_10600 [Ancylomarina longa]
MKVKKTVLLVLGILLFQVSFSQENFQPGIIINNQKDTVSGFIDFRDWIKNPHEITFKDKITNKVNIYKPCDLLEFRVANEIYESAIINFETSAYHTGKLTTDPSLHLHKDTIFLQTVIKGNKSLYYLKSKNGNVNFYIKKDSKFELLIYKKYLKEKEGNQIQIENKKYLGQLSEYLKDYITSSSKFKIYKYNLKSLKKLFQYYYSISQTKISFQKKKEKISVELGLLSGASFSSLKFNNSKFFTLTKTNFSKSTDFAAGIFLDLILSKKQKKWSICNELFYTSATYTSQYDDYINEDSYAITYNEIGESYLKLNNLIRYRYPIGKLFIYLNGGISNGFAFSETNSQIKKSTRGTTVSTDKGKALDDSRSYEQSFLLGLGVKHKKISFELRYEKGNGMSKSIQSITQRFYLLFGYRF